MYVYMRTEQSPYELYTVGFYDPQGKWITDSDYNKAEEAAERVHYLNGGAESSTKGSSVYENLRLKERLTKRINGRAASKKDMGDLRNLREVIDKLAEYEEIE